MPDAPLIELTRGRIVESLHSGSIAVVDSNGTLLASCGDPYKVAFLRSSAKAFQVLPFVERGGVEHFGFTPQELSISCASHEGSAAHAATIRGMQAKIGIQESDLQCGVHMPGDAAMHKSLLESGAQPGPNLNNCSGKHTAMLAHAIMRGLPVNNYLERDHPIQQDILATFADMCRIDPGDVEIGVDGCSAPNFAVPLYNAALALARLADPQGLAEQRAAGCREITTAMMSHPDMVSGPGEFDCELMRVGAGRLICKRGAEGYQAVALLPGATGNGSRGIGIAFKIVDGDQGHLPNDQAASSRARPAVVLEVLRHLNIFSDQELGSLSAFGPVRPIHNHRGIVTGESRPVFKL